MSSAVHRQPSTKQGTLPLNRFVQHVAGHARTVARGGLVSFLLLCRPPAVLTLVELLQLSGARRVANHFFRIVGKLPHDVQKFPFPAHCSIHVNAGEKHREALISALPHLLK